MRTVQTIVHCIARDEIHGEQPQTVHGLILVPGLWPDRRTTLGTLALTPSLCTLQCPAGRGAPPLVHARALRRMHCACMQGSAPIRPGPLDRRRAPVLRPTAVYATHSDSTVAGSTNIDTQFSIFHAGVTGYRNGRS